MPDLPMWGTVETVTIQQDTRLAPPDGFWLRFYPRIVTSTAEEIMFDRLPVRDRRLAPFVAPNVQGRIMRRKGRPMASFKPAYVKPKHNVTPDQAIPRRPGEPLLGNLSLEQRYNAIIADCLREERESIERRWDWMACQAAAYGYVDVWGEDYPKVRVDFGRSPDLTIVLAGGAMWSAETATPMDDLNLARKRAFAAGGSSVNNLIFGLTAWTNFTARVDFDKMLDKNNRGSESVLNNTGLQSGEPFEYQGRIRGPNGGGLVDIWTYSNQYEDEAGDTQEFMDPRDVVGIGNNFQGVRAFGAILDKRSLQAIPMFPKVWDQNEDPSGTFTMTQSAPLMVPGNPDNSFRIRTST